MSMPIINGSTITRNQAITDIIQSIALEQTALSHILNAEGEKIQTILASAVATPRLILNVNNSVKATIDSIARLEIILQMKLELFADCLCEQAPQVIEPTVG